MSHNKELGKRGEDVALGFLLRQGLRLRERNVQVGHREIDLVMESDEKLHIVEVKALTEFPQADPTDKVDARKRQLLASAAGQYMAQEHITKEVQFDVVSVIFRGADFEIDYLPDAFIPVYYR